MTKHKYPASKQVGIGKLKKSKVASRSIKTSASRKGIS